MKPHCLRPSAWPPARLLAKAALVALASLHATPGQAETPAEGWRLGAVLDVAITSRAQALGGRDRGLQLGHSDVSATGPLGPWLRGQAVASFATHEGRLEKGIEEAYVETTALPAGLALRIGRFAAQIGHLNAQHPHADDFVERPLLYRAFFGGHWTDDGARLAWTAPTPFYLAFSAEAFRGQRLVEETSAPARRPGIGTLGLKLGADVNREHSFLTGLSYIRNRRQAALEAHHDDEDAASTETADGQTHEHSDHGARFSGRHTWLLDATWKWAPGGNNRSEQLRVSAETARITGFDHQGRPTPRHQARTLAVVWRFHPSLEVGARTDWLRVQQLHEGDLENGRLREAAVMVTWKPTHLQMLRLQTTRQWHAVDIDGPARRSVQLQYVMAFGAHGAHSF